MATFSTEEKVDLLFKKFFDKPTTDVNLPFYSEPSSSNGQKLILQSQILSQDVPSSVPVDGWDTGIADTTLATFKASMNNGDTINHSTYPIQYVYKAQMSIVTNGNNKAYKCMSGTTNLLQYSLPFSLDSQGSYGVELYSSANNRIYDGTGEWVIDVDHGILTFFHYETVQSYVSSTLLPRISFFRYTGSRGLSSFQSLWTETSSSIYHINKNVMIGTTTNSQTDSYDLEVQGDIKSYANVHCQELILDSDKELKKNIQPIQNALGILQKIDGCKYQWQSNNQVSYGCIAQQLLDSMPHSVVHESKKNKNKGVKYTHLIAVLVEAVKSQQKQIESLKQEIRVLYNWLNPSHRPKQTHKDS